MPKINTVARALPPYKYTQGEVRDFVLEHFAKSDLPVRKLAEVFDNAAIEERYFSVPMEWFRSEKSFLDKNQAYLDSAVALGDECARKCLQQAGVTADDIDYIIFVSTTGLATPSIDARLINLLGLRSDVRRTPIWGLGCAGGAAGLAHAYHHLLGHPAERVLLVAVELCGLTFQQSDFTKSNFVATAIFGEGAAAVLLSGDGLDSRGIEILGTRSTFWPDSLDVMGWNVMNTGLQVVFAQSIPHIVETRARQNMIDFLAEYDLTLGDIAHHVFHPGGAKVIAAYDSALRLTNGALDYCRDSLCRYGNMSAVSVLFVLAEHLETYLGDGKLGIISALGPGFCAENLLVRF